MKKLALLLAVAVAASAPTAAFAAKKKAAKPAAAAVDPNANSKKLMRELAMQPVYVWQSATKPMVKADAKPAKKAKKKKA